MNYHLFNYTNMLYNKDKWKNKYLNTFESGIMKLYSVN